MLNDILNIIKKSMTQGWVLEPDAKSILAMSGIEVPRFCYAGTVEEALRFGGSNGYPLVAKLVSTDIMHKSDVGGVAVGIVDEAELNSHFERFRRMQGFTGVLVEEMAEGIEMIVGAKVDFQFGPVILLGMGGTGTEIYQDVTVRMAPLCESDVGAMVKKLKAHQLLEGFRGSPPVNMIELTKTLLSFSELVMNLEDQFESIDLNPVMCSEKKCVVADARIILKA